MGGNNTNAVVSMDGTIFHIFRRECEVFPLATKNEAGSNEEGQCSFPWCFEWVF